MRTATKIILTLIVLVGGLLCLRLLIYRPLSQDDLSDAGFLDELNDLSKTTSSKYETKGTISGLEVYIVGQISGKGVVKVSYNDSTSYREYEISSGTVDIKHKSDWYSEICYVTFVPTQPTNGKIAINCNFIGD